MKNLYKKYKEIILYVFFGGLTTLVNIASYALCTRIFIINEYTSNLIAWILAVLFAYVTNRKYVFNSKKNKFKEKLSEFFSFFGFRVLSLVIDMAMMYVLIDKFEVNDMISKIIVNVVIIIVNYVFSKLLIFKK
jgi:putative flippase GtrA